MTTHENTPASRFAAILLCGIVAVALSASAQNDGPTQAQIEQTVKGLQFQHGQINIKDGLATLNVPASFKYLDAKGAKTVLVDLWGNPSEQADDVIGLLMPADLSPLDTNCWAVTISYDDSGYVRDDDASKINYDDLLKQMQQGVRDEKRNAQIRVILRLNSSAGRLRRVMTRQRINYIGRRTSGLRANRRTH